MNELTAITAFRLVRRLIIGQSASSMYLLLCEDKLVPAVEADLQAEVEIQMGVGLTVARLSELSQLADALGARDGGAVRALWIDEWSSSLIAALDTHVVRLEQTGAQFLFITSAAFGERLLTEAPNFRPKPAHRGAHLNT